MFTKGSIQARVPEEIRTKRLCIRIPTLQDAKPLRDAILSSLDELSDWLSFAQTRPTPATSRAYCAQARKRFEKRQTFEYILLDQADQRIVGAVGVPRLDWKVPRFEIGYWLCTDETGKGYCTEAVLALTEMAFKLLRAERVEIRMNPENSKSAGVAERAGFILEGVLRNDSVTPQGQLRSTKVYALTREDFLRAAKRRPIGHSKPAARARSFPVGA